DPRLDPLHRRRRRVALAQRPRLHPALSADERAHARVRRDRSRRDLALHAEIRGCRHQCRDRRRLRLGRNGREADHPGGRRAAGRGPAAHARDPRLLPPVHPRLGRLFLRQGGLLRLDRLDPAPAPGDGAEIGGQRDAGPAALLPLPPPRAFAEAGRARRRFAREAGMTIRSDEAAATLADIESVVAKVKQSRIYRDAALVIILWGFVDLARDLMIALDPEWFGPRWFLVDLVGVVGTLALLRYRATPAGRFRLRVLAAFALFYAFGWIWSHLIGRFGPREEMAFWPTLFLFGYSLAGLWFGAAFAAIGLGLAALVVGGYLWIGETFNLWLAAVTGFGFIACGLWMRRG